MKNCRFLPLKLAIVTGERKKKSVTFHAGLHASSERMRECENSWFDGLELGFTLSLGSTPSGINFFFHFTFFSFLLFFVHYE